MYPKDHGQAPNNYLCLHYGKFVNDRLWRRWCSSPHHVDWFCTLRSSPAVSFTPLSHSLEGIGHIQWYFQTAEIMAVKFSTGSFFVSLKITWLAPDLQSCVLPHPKLEKSPKFRCCATRVHCGHCNHPKNYFLHPADQSPHMSTSLSAPLWLHSIPTALGTCINLAW